MNINTKQRRTIAALIQARSVTHASELSGVPIRTLRRWLSDPEFRTELNAAEDVLVTDATRRLAGLASGAIETLEEVRANLDYPPSARIRAAQIELDYLLKMRELRDIENRLAELEAAVFGKVND